MVHSVVNEITRTVINNPTIPAAEAFEALRIWGESVFGEGTAHSLALRVQKEMKELLVETEHGWTEKAVEEAADIIGVLTRAPGLWEALVKKMNVNFEREWTLHGDGTGSHIPKEGKSDGKETDYRAEALRRLALETGLGESYNNDVEWWFSVKLAGNEHLLESSLKIIEHLLKTKGESTMSEDKESAVELKTNTVDIEMSDEVRKHLTIVDIENIAQLTNKIEMIANKVGLEARLELHPMTDAP